MLFDEARHRETQEWWIHKLVELERKHAAEIEKWKLAWAAEHDDD